MVSVADCTRGEERVTIQVDLKCHLAWRVRGANEVVVPIFMDWFTSAWSRKLGALFPAILRCSQLNWND